MKTPRHIAAPKLAALLAGAAALHLSAALALAQPPPPPAGQRPPPPPRRGEAAETNLDPAFAMVAVKTVGTALRSFTPTPGWIKVHPRGERDAEAGLSYQNQIVARLRLVGPEAAPALKGTPPAAVNAEPKWLEAWQARSGSVLQALQPGNSAEIDRPKGCWRVPVVFNGGVVAHLRVSPDGATILPDEEAARDAAIYGAK